MGRWIIDGKIYTNEEHEELKRQQEAARIAKERAELEQIWRSSQPGRLLRELGEIYVAYRASLSEDPGLEKDALEFDEANQRLFNRMKSSIERAQNAPRCTRIMAGGRRCRAPKMRGKKFCHMHLAMEEARPKALNLPSLDDANGIQLAIAKAAQALVDGKLDPTQASRLAYYLQLALTNVGRVNFEDEEDEEEEYVE